MPKNEAFRIESFPYNHKIFYQFSYCKGEMILKNRRFCVLLFLMEPGYDSYKKLVVFTLTFTELISLVPLKLVKRALTLW